MAVIQWYPGHMAKAIRQVQEKLKLVDIVLELVDARIPESSRNPQIKEVIKQKNKIVVLTKKDLADPIMTARWISFYENNNQPAIAIDATKDSLKRLESKIKDVLATTFINRNNRGISSRNIKAMCIGIPNVGKSTLLNHLVKKNIAQTGNKPGVTKAQQWIKAGKNLQLLDTPGILWPKFEDILVGKKLALTGAIKDTLFSKDDVALYALDYLRKNHSKELIERYKLSKEQIDTSTTVDLLLIITKKMGFFDDYDRGSERLIFEMRRKKLGRYTLDNFEELHENS